MAAQPQSAAPRGSIEQETAGTLLSRLLNDATALLRNEVALAKAEFHNTTTNLKAGVGAMAIGGAVLFAGALALLAAAVLALALVVDAWLAALIVGAALAIIGFVMVQGAKKKLEPGNLALERTQSSLKQDAQVVARRT